MSGFIGNLWPYISEAVGGTTTLAEFTSLTWTTTELAEIIVAAVAAMGAMDFIIAAAAAAGVGMGI